jgi:hypothetical protein
VIAGSQSVRGVDPAGGTGTIAQSGGRDAVGWRLPRDIGCAGAIQLSAWLDSEPVGVGLVLGGLLVLAGVYVGCAPSRPNDSSGCEYENLTWVDPGP